MAEYNEGEISQMIQAAWEHMDLGEYDEAEEIATKLLHSEEEAGYPLMAGILTLKEEPEEAVNLLKEGIDKNPNSWRLKLELGNLYGQLQNIPVAMAIFDEASQLPGAEVHWIELNRGIAYFKGGMVDDALNTLQVIDHPEAINEAFSLQLEILDILGQHQLILAMAKEELALLSAPKDPEENQTLSNIYSRVATAYWYEEEDNADAIQYHLKRAIELDRTNQQSLWLIREMDQEYSEEAHIYELIVEGRLVLLDDEEQEVVYPFHSEYVVLANSPQDALEMIKEFEIEYVDKTSLEILEATSESNDEEEPLGIYYVGDLMFVDGEEADEEEEEIEE
ncbi:MAG: hypothetical protein MRZ79_26015 [Bacteroidia bacterium]|nr:hypothetical protein [Bacteroidia bacterium]